MDEKKRETQSGQSGNRAVARREERTPSAASMGNSPFGFMRRFAEEMDRLFEDFGFGGGLTPRIEMGTPRWGGTTWAPDIDVFEREGNLVVRADLPGMNREDVQVEVRENALCLSGERRSEEERREEGYYRLERGYGGFCRTVPLPQGIDVDKAQASFKDGVLEVKVPIPPGRGARRIEIQGGAPETQRQKAAS